MNASIPPNMPAPSPAGHLDRDVVRLRGRDTIPLLQSLLTCDVDHLAPGDMAHGALLTPQGKIIDTLMLSRTDEGLYMDVSSGRGDGLRRKLTLYRLRADVEIEDASSDICVGIGASPTKALISAPDPRFSALPSRWLAPKDSLPADLPSAEQTLRTIEIQLGVPSFGEAFEETEVFPLDVNLDLLHGIDHKKGCFVGQEVASRMFRKGEVRKRTYRVIGEALEKGGAITADGTTIGTILTALGPDGLVMVRVDRLKSKEGHPILGPTDQPLIVQKPEYDVK
ncbi:MAG: folate-binding protein [Pseudomonadota bacterium]